MISHHFWNVSNKEAEYVNSFGRRVKNVMIQKMTHNNLEGVMFLVTGNAVIMTLDDHSDTNCIS